MSFLNQALLFGLFAVSIPIIIHLLNRRRFRKVKWAAMRFLKVSVEQNQRRMNLEDWILLLLRCALVALLALALARPMLAGLNKALPGSKVAAAVVIDNSASMGTTEGEGTRLDQAREAARAVIDSLPTGASVAIATPFRPDEPTTDHALARQRIEDLQQTDRHADLLSAIERAARAVEGQAAAERELYLITDGHREEWSAFSALEEKMRELSAGTKLHLVLVGTPALANLGISRLTPSAALPAVDQPFRIDVDVTNFGGTPVTEVPVTLSVNEQVVGEPWIIDEIQPGRSESATLYATLAAAGYHRLTVSLGGDAVGFDDERTAVVRAVDDVRVLLVDGEPGLERRESETFFLRHALAPVPVEEQGAYPVKPVVVSALELANENLDDYEAIVLANVSDLPIPLAERMAKYVEAGGGLIVFPGANVRPEVYNTLLHTREGLLPATIAALDDEGLVHRLVPAETNPLGIDRELLAPASFRGRTRVEAAGGDGRIVLRYDDGEPALVESSFGLGKVFFFTSTADLAWNDFAVKPGFVPFVNRLLGGIVQHRDASLNIAAGAPLRHRVAQDLAGREATVYEVGDPESLGRLTTIGDENGAAVLTFADTQRAGGYEATVEGESTPVVFAAQPSARESSLELLGSEQVDRLADSVEVVRWSASSRLGAERKGSELWLPLLFCVIGIAVLELGLAQWFSRPK